MKKKLVFVWWLVTMLMLISCSTERRARRLVRQGFKKFDKAVQLDPSVADTLSRVDTIYITVPEHSDSTDINTALDTGAFDQSINQYDSLNDVIDSLGAVAASGDLTTAQLEQTLAQARRTNAALTAAKNRLMQGFQKDSTYTYQDDRLSAEFLFKDGLFKNFKYTIKPIEVDTAVTTSKIVMDGSRGVSPVYRYITLVYSIFTVIAAMIILYKWLSTRDPR